MWLGDNTPNREKKLTIDKIKNKCYNNNVIKIKKQTK